MRPDDIDLVCQHYGNLRWVSARKSHRCVHCGNQAAVDGDEYLRDDRYLGGAPVCRECAWARYGPEGTEPAPADHRRYHRSGRGCLLDRNSPEWEAAEEARLDAEAKAVEAALGDLWK